MKKIIGCYIYKKKKELFLLMDIDREYFNYSWNVIFPILLDSIEIDLLNWFEIISIVLKNLKLKSYYWINNYKYYARLLFSVMVIW